VNGTDLFHNGIVVDDYEDTLERLTALFGYQWCDEIRVDQPIVLPDGDVTYKLCFTYSMTAPRLEIIRSIEGTLWTPAAGSGIHHLGYWSDDVPADSAALEARGYAREAAGMGPDGQPFWTYHRGPTGPRIELVSTGAKEGMEQYWSTGKVPF
jgi:hypothetical protein